MSFFVCTRPDEEGYPTRGNMAYVLCLVVSVCWPHRVYLTIFSSSSSSFFFKRRRRKHILFVCFSYHSTGNFIGQSRDFYIQQPMGKGFVCVSLSWVTDKERDETLIGFTMCRSHLLLLERRGGLRNPTGIYFFFLFYLNHSSH